MTGVQCFCKSYIEPAVNGDLDVENGLLQDYQKAGVTIFG
jgi:hypothetical protein